MVSEELSRGVVLKWKYPGIPDCNELCKAFHRLHVETGVLLWNCPNAGSLQSQMSAVFQPSGLLPYPTKDKKHV